MLESKDNNTQKSGNNIEGSGNNIERLDFHCNLSKNVIEYKCYKKEKEAHIEYNNIDPTLYKLYFVILRISIDNLTKKGYEKIVQSVMEEDWNNYLKNDKRWVIKYIIKYPNMNCYVIECGIGDALGCISRGLGLTSS